MVVTLDLSEDAKARLEAEAARRGISLGELVAHLAEQLPSQPKPQRPRRLSFVALGSSGRTEPLDIRAERAALAARKLAEGV